MRPMIGSSQSGKQRPEREGREPEGDDDEAVTDGIQRPEADRLDLLGADPALDRTPRPCASGSRRRHSPRSRPVAGDSRAGREARASPCACHLRRAAVAVLVAVAREVSLGVGRHRRRVAAAVVLVMSVIAAMWSQSMPWRMPSSRPVTSTPTPAGLASICAMKSSIDPFVSL